MADRGGGSTGNSSLDGAFLLQLLRNPPQSSSSSPSSSSSSSFHQQTLTHHGPAVGHFSPSPSSSHPPPGFHRDPRRAPPHSQQFSGSPPVFDHILHRPHNSHYSASPPPLGGGNSHSSASPPPPSFGGGARDFGGNSANINASRKVLGSRSQTQSNANGNSPESVTSYWHKSMQAPPHHHVVSSSSSSSGNFRSVDAQRQEVQQNVGRREVHGHGHGHGQSLLHRELMGRQPTAVGNGRGFLDEGDGLVGGRRGGCESGDDLAEELEELSVTEESSVGKRSNSSRAKEVRLDMYRGHYVSSQRVRIRRRETECRYDIDSLTPLFLSIYKSLIPASKEKQKQNQLLLSLAKLVNKEWPNAQLHLYGSCANSFGVSNSDIDICLAIDDNNTSKSDILLKLADILESNNLQNVQALTHARVPIVKMMDPVTGISCDICTNNLLAVANTKLLSDYAQIDGRLRQLAFIVKHWAKSRGVNETYRGTLSSYAYVLMCIHFLQMRKPAILPCLQGMEPTYAVTLDGTTCVYFDQVDRLHNFGAQNNESIARLVWNFFHYWAYCHDYMNDVISVRTGQIISKRSKDWTRRIGNDRHLICIEDPFETSHDLGRVVDKFSIKILREEFERAAYVLQYDRNPTVTLFEPYVPNPMQNGIQSD